jgi:hypothetical protein
MQPADAKVHVLLGIAAVQLAQDTEEAMFYPTHGFGFSFIKVDIACSKNTSYVLSGHRDGCVLWSRVSSNMNRRNESQTSHASYKNREVLSIVTIRNNSYCPPCESQGATRQSIKLVDIGRMLTKQRRIVGVAVTEANELLMLRDRQRDPIRTEIGANVLHVYHENKQVWLNTSVAQAGDAVSHRQTRSQAQGEVMSDRI